MKTGTTRLLFLSLNVLFSFGLLACSRSPEPPSSKEAEPPAEATAGVPKPTIEQLEAAIPENPLRDAYFGETHVHTSYSLDGYIGGGRLTPSDAYRFAKGEDVTLNGRVHNIIKPLDFAAVSDHAEFLGEMYSTQVRGAPGYDNEMLNELRNLSTWEEQEAWFTKYVSGNMRSATPAHPPFYAGEETTVSAWKDIEVAAAVEHYEPGRFTTLVGFEWTATEQAGNMHRNVLFRDLVVPDMPISGFDTNDEEKLWAWMAEQEAKGSTLFAIPHNSNASKGFMFGSVDNAGQPFTAEYAEQRSKWEPLIEMMQIKGNSEVHPGFWPSDEFAGFENGNSIQNSSGRVFAPNDFVRWAVTNGLYYQQSLGANPFKLGFIGGTDNHNGTPSDVVEDNYAGSHGGADNTVEKRRTGDITGWILARDANPGSLAGVWATKNTRGAIWDGMKARETFVTSGTRIKPRMFCGATLNTTTQSPQAMAEDGYANGVPMGGTLPASQVAPVCTVYAIKDPDGANLDRIQIIKGWVDANGEPRDLVIDVAWSGDREPDQNGRLPPVGNTVNLETAAYTNDIGAVELVGVWQDPGFDPQQNALYYARVLEIPTPRWTTYEAVSNDLPLLNDVPATIQERAWTSPIWYQP